MWSARETQKHRCRLDYSSSARHKFVKHQHYIPMPRTISRNITYINIMRDPVKRFISGYYFWRFCFEYFSSVNRTIQRIDSLQLPFLYKIIDRKWLDENIRICHDCKDNRLYFLRDFDILETLNKSFSSWLKKIYRTA